jgi:hypothetical protein
MVESWQRFFTRHCFRIREALGTVSRKICESASVRGKEDTKEEEDHSGEMGKFRSLWCMITVICEYSLLSLYAFEAQSDVTASQVSHGFILQRGFSELK